MSGQKITPHLWFDKEAVEAAEFYTTVFPDGQITHQSILRDTPSGDCDIVGFTIMGYSFMAISAGPYFQINPSISFHVKLRTAAEIDALWAKLAEGGAVLMPLEEYPFSPRYGWVQDRFGVSWQIDLAAEGAGPGITPSLMFTQDKCGQAEEAVDFYSSLFPDGRGQVFVRYGQGEEPDREGTVKYAQFILAGQPFGAMDSAYSHEFTFNEAVSLIVNCRDQAEIDYFWEKLSAVPEAEQCGWIKDKFGVSWQIVPENIDELMGRNPEKTTPVMLEMKKIDIAALERAAGS